ncbi:aldo/keto reductase [Lysobacter antibioticus]|uniref:aldo/keto reductase n=1 Tax=Lysobacter antibioticus TaxID=84531 RepID=UPI00034A6E2D|nr:aldo/keto reductase [Lysobacter antibioticus]
MANLQLSPIVAGAWRMRDWNFDLSQRQRWIEAALELGIDSFDHADIYGDYTVEGLFGEALAVSPGLRDRVRLVTKCGIKLTSAQRPQHRIKSYDTSRDHVVASVEQSLRALRTDRVDLLLIHRPDLLMDVDELAATFDALKAAGKVLHVGVSNHSPSQLALLHAKHRLETHQIECSPLHPAPLDDGTLDQCQALGLRPMIWSPLAGGRLFGGGDERAERVRAVLAELAPRYGDASAATLAYAWLLRHPSRPWPITGSGRIEGLREATAALSLRLSAEDWYAIWQAGAGREVA